MHPILLPVVPIAVLTISAVACGISAYKTWKDKQQLKLKLSKLVYDTLDLCNTHYNEKIYKLDQMKLKNLQTRSNEVKKFCYDNKIKDPNNYINNVFNTCQYIILDRQIHYSMKPEDFKKKFKKEIGYIIKTIKKL